MNRAIDNKWISIVASIWIQCTSGSLYTFGIYSPVLKLSQGYDQSTLATVSVFKDVGGNTGVLSGLLYSAATARSRGGPWIVLPPALPYASPPHVPAMCLYMFVAAHAQTFFNTANVVTAVRNFPNYSGTAVGIMKGFVGLSGAVLVQVYRTILPNKPASYLLLLSLLPTVNALLLMCFVRIYGTIIILENALSLPSAARIIAFTVLILLVASPFCITIRAYMSDTETILQTDVTGYHQLPRDEKAEVDTNEKALQLEENQNLLQALCTPDFWLLFVSTACGMGSGLATVNNISQIGGSLGYSNFETSGLVSLWSIWNFLGRFGAGYVSDYFLHVNGWARPLFMAITLAAMSIGHCVIASGLPAALYIGSVLVGVCYGSQWSLMPTVASEIFGVVHMGTIFNTITVASPVGSYILSVRVVGYIYDKEASIEGNMCRGTYCFMLSFFIMASAALLGCLAAVILFFRTKTFYQQVILIRVRRSSRE
ncbi:hypothetical protein NMG60_11009566 [Bertholletia excelsa]